LQAHFSHTSRLFVYSLPVVWTYGMSDALQRIGLCRADVHRYVTRRVVNRSDAADIVQQTLLTACVSIASFRGENLQGWLFAIARHLITDASSSTWRTQHSKTTA
jgi:DNA-directed RNA polymerase specialized sigma24 family protein